MVPKPYTNWKTAEIAPFCVYAGNPVFRTACWIATAKASQFGPMLRNRPTSGDTHG